MNHTSPQYQTGGSDVSTGHQGMGPEEMARLSSVKPGETDVQVYQCYAVSGSSITELSTAHRLGPYTSLSTAHRTVPYTTSVPHIAQHATRYLSTARRIPR
eukprot:112130-Rhodomonas_salina.2